MNVRVVHHTYPMHHPLNTCAQPGAQSFRILVSVANNIQFQFNNQGQNLHLHQKSPYVVHK